MPGTSEKKKKEVAQTPLTFKCMAYRKEASLLSFPARVILGKPHGGVHRGKACHIDCSHKPRAHRPHWTLWLCGQGRCKYLYKQMGWDVAQLVDCSPSMQEALGLITSTS